MASNIALRPFQPRQTDHDREPGLATAFLGLMRSLWVTRVCRSLRLYTSVTLTCSKLLLFRSTTDCLKHSDSVLPENNLLYQLRQISGTRV